MAFKLLSDQSATSSVSEIDFTSGITSAYKSYRFVWYDYRVTEGNLSFMASIDNSAWDVRVTSNFLQSWNNEASNNDNLNAAIGGGYAQGDDNASTFLVLESMSFGQADSHICGELWLMNPASTTFGKMWWHRCASSYNVGQIHSWSGGYFDTASAITGIRFACGAAGELGDDITGSFKMYGVS